MWYFEEGGVVFLRGRCGNLKMAIFPVVFFITNLFTQHNPFFIYPYHSVHLTTPATNPDVSRRHTAATDTMRIMSSQVKAAKLSLMNIIPASVIISPLPAHSPTPLLHATVLSSTPAAMTVGVLSPNIGIRRRSVVSTVPSTITATIAVTATGLPPMPPHRSSPHSTAHDLLMAQVS